MGASMSTFPRGEAGGGRGGGECINGKAWLVEGIDFLLWRHMKLFCYTGELLFGEWLDVAACGAR